MTDLFSLPQRAVIGDSRAMTELADGSVQLTLTSPPYWSIKDYGTSDQVGFGQSLHEYLKDLYRVWAECHRVLEPGRRLIVNIGDQFARAQVYGRYKVIPLHAEVIGQAEQLGFDYLGSIIWQKKTTLNTSGGAVIMGSFPHPPNGIVELDYEHILIFKKPGKPRRIAPEIKAKAALTKDEWKTCFAGHWYFGGAKKHDHQAIFPEELPRRLIRMFSFPGELVLDPFLGSGTSLKAAQDLDRAGIGYEINPEFGELIRAKVEGVEIVEGGSGPATRKPIDYTPVIQDATPLAEEEIQPQTYRVKEIPSPDRLRLSDGREIGFLGLRVTHPEEVAEYLEKRVRGKLVLLKKDGGEMGETESGPAYVYLKNRIFINAQVLKSGWAEVDNEAEFKKRGWFRRYAAQGREQ